VSECDFVFDALVKDASESKSVELNLFRWCASFWRPNEQYSNGEYARPTNPTGFAYQGTAGTSGSREPVWPRTIDATVSDGSVTWTCKAAGSNGLNSISSPVGVSDPSGLTISDVSVSELTKILATYAGGTLGQDFEAVFTFTLNGVPRVARQLVKIRKR
jgi:hypothetical protein